MNNPQPINSISIQIPSLIENIRIVESFIDNAKDRFKLTDDIYGNIMATKEIKAKMLRLNWTLAMM